MCTLTDESNTETHIVFRNSCVSSDMSCHSELGGLDSTARVLMQAAASLEDASREDLEVKRAMCMQDHVS